jgi:hypothetical protein
LDCPFPSDDPVFLPLAQFGAGRYLFALNFGDVGDKEGRFSSFTSLAENLPIFTAISMIASSPSRCFLGAHIPLIFSCPLHMLKYAQISFTHLWVLQEWHIDWFLICITQMYAL